MQLVQKRFSVGLRTYVEAQQLAGEVAGHKPLVDVSEVAELQFMAGRVVLPGSPDEIWLAREKMRAARVLEAIALRAVLTPSDLVQRLPGVPVAVLRMGPVRAVSDTDLTPEQSELVPLSQVDVYAAESVTAGSGYVRRRIGMSLADDAAAAWSSARGYWRLSPDIRYLVPTRFGYSPYVFRVDDWMTLHENLVWARAGWLIDPVRGVRSPMVGEGDADGISAAAEEPATSTDVQVALALGGGVLALGRRGPNPVVRLVGQGS